MIHSSTVPQEEGGFSSILQIVSGGGKPGTRELNSMSITGIDSALVSCHSRSAPWGSITCDNCIFLKSPSPFTIDPHRANPIHPQRRVAFTSRQGKIQRAKKEKCACIVEGTMPLCPAELARVMLSENLFLLMSHAPRPIHSPEVDQKVLQNSVLQDCSTGKEEYFRLLFRQVREDRKCTDSACSKEFVK